MPEIKHDCRYYRGSKPCRWNKEHNVECSDCRFYSQYNEKILIIKLDAMGDVLRTTCILPKIRERYPSAYIVWVVKSESRELLVSNPFIDEIWNYEDMETLSRLHVHAWDYVYNLDNAHASCALASVAKSGEKTGFVLSERGTIMPTNEPAMKWLRMASFDRIKKENLQSYQAILHEICGFPPPFEKPCLVIPEAFSKKATTFVKEKLPVANAQKYIIGVNTGSGARWSLKMLEENKIIGLIDVLLSHNPDFHILLLGGPNEREKNANIMSALNSERIANAGCDHSLLGFSAIISKCDTIVCGDTLALHIATALGIPSVVCFGPTSSSEIYDYDGLINKVCSQTLSCLSCYNNICHETLTCMDSISLDEIREKIGILFLRARNRDFEIAV